MSLWDLQSQRGLSIHPTQQAQVHSMICSLPFIKQWRLFWILQLVVYPRKTKARWQPEMPLRVGNLLQFKKNKNKLLKKV
jgi:hypothetical protein